MNGNLNDILHIIDEHRGELVSEFKVKDIGVFGSYTRGEQTEHSDVDILVSFREPVGFEFLDLAERLETLLDTRVDLVTPDALRPRSREHILNEVVYV